MVQLPVGENTWARARAKTVTESFSATIASEMTGEALSITLRGGGTPSARNNASTRLRSRLPKGWRIQVASTRSAAVSGRPSRSSGWPSRQTKHSSSLLIS